MRFQLKDVASQKGKVAIVTGANIGLGYETTLGLVSKDVQVIMACRNFDKAHKAKSKIEAQFPEAQLEVIQLDLGSFQSVRAFVKNFTTKYDRLDLLIENAGIMMPPFMQTEDGFESQFGVNHLGHFLLTHLLYPTIQKTPQARIITLSSIAHKNGRIDFENLNAEVKYSKMGAYGQSKLACLMFALELDRKLRKSGSETIAVSAHPGASNTNLGQHLNKTLYKLLLPLMSFFIHDPKEAALPTLYAALGTDIQGGDYVGPTGFNEMKGKPGKVKALPHAYDAEVAKRLWEVSEEFIGQKFEV